MNAWALTVGRFTWCIFLRAITGNVCSKIDFFLFVASLLVLSLFCFFYLYVADSHVQIYL